jgi:hypothetical protein
MGDRMHELIDTTTCSSLHLLSDLSVERERQHWDFFPNKSTPKIFIDTEDDIDCDYKEGRLFQP